MSMTIADCASETAAMRRERRRQRILQNGQERLSAILSGPEGNEKRQAPSIEGYYEKEEMEDGDKINNKDGQRVGDGAETSFVQDEIQFVAPIYCELVDRHRFWLMITLGFAFRIAVQLAMLEYVLLTFTGMFCAWELAVAIPQKRLLKKYPKHGYLVNTLLISGLNERMVIWLGILLDLLWEFGMDLCLVTFSFLCTHLLLQLVDTIMKAPCCSSIV